MARLSLTRPFWDWVDRSAGLDSCWPWIGHRTHHGYGQTKQNGRKTSAHRHVFFLAHGYLPPVVRHSCDNPPCCNPLHLLGGTQADNIRDREERGRSVRRHGHSKLRDEQVVEIRRLSAAGGVSQRGLGRRFGISHTMVARIIGGDGRGS